jgi:hypothetical protein
MSDDAGRVRFERLRDNVQKLRTRGGGSARPIERWLMIAGGAMVVIGLPLILLGWLGAARTPYVFEQVPYLISGGLLGLALAVVGGLFYFAYWITRQIHETRRQTEETRSALVKIQELLAAGAAASGNGSPRKRATAPAGNGTFVATAKGTMFHRPDCVVVSGRSDLHEVAGEKSGLEPCKVCDPLASVS